MSRDYTEAFSSFNDDQWAGCARNTMLAGRLSRRARADNSFNPDVRNLVKFGEILANKDEFNEACEYFRNNRDLKDGMVRNAIDSRNSLRELQKKRQYYELSVRLEGMDLRVLDELLASSFYDALEAYIVCDDGINDTGFRKLVGASYGDAARRNNSGLVGSHETMIDAYDSDYAIMYNYADNKLFFRSLDYCAEVPIGSGFVFADMIIGMSNLRNSVSYYCDCVEMYKQDMISDYGIHSPNKVTDWLKLSQKYEENWFVMLYSGDDTRLMVRKLAGTDGEFFRVFAVIVDGMRVVKQDEFIFSVKFIEQMIQDIVARSEEDFE